MHHKAYVDMTAAMNQVRSGDKFVSVNRELTWVPETITESKVQTFVEAVKSAYASDETTVEFDGTTYQVDFVVERKDFSMKPGRNGQFDVVLNEQVLRSFQDNRQAKVYLVTKQHDLNGAPKKTFNNSLVKSIKTL
jgi:hypothetical protein|tara:strand:- start:4810 stop:5217 length:408 start_codon:yes stop_codon:yes gene_type:complete